MTDNPTTQLIQRLLYAINQELTMAQKDGVIQGAIQNLLAPISKHLEKYYSNLNEESNAQPSEEVVKILSLVKELKQTKP